MWQSISSSAFRLLFKAIFVSGWLVWTLSAVAADGVRPVDLSLKSLVYDSFTGNLYGGGTNDLLQIDPDTGAVLQSFRLGTNVTRLSLGAQHGLWVALQGENAVLRFDLETLSPGEKIHVPGGAIYGLAASPNEPFTAAVSSGAIVGVWQSTYIIKNGALLPQSLPQYSGYLAMQGSFVYANIGFAVEMRVDSNGLVYVRNFPSGLSYGHIQVQGTKLYHPSGTVFDLPSGAPVLNFFPAAAPGNSTFGINSEAGSIFFLSPPGPWILDRFDLSSGKLTGRYYFPVLDPEPQPRDVDLVAWSSNRLAFNTSTNLYLLDSDKLFVPGDIEVSQTVTPSKIAFGDLATITVTITNKGPGAALHLSLTNSASPVVYLVGNANGAVIQSNQVSLNIGSLAPGSKFDFTIPVVAARPGTLSSQTTVSSENDTNLANNSNTISQDVSIDSVANGLSLAAREVVFDAATQKLLLLDTSSRLWPIDPLADEIDVPGAFPWTGITLPQNGGFVYAHSPNRTIDRIDTRTFAAEVAIRSVGANMVDMDVSPADPTLVALADEQGTHLYRNGVLLPNGLTRAGNLHFSEDGTKLIVVNPNTCGLEIYNVDTNGLTLDKVGADASCSPFRVANGLVYFDSGLTYDAATGEPSTNSLKLSAPSFVSPGANGVVDVLSRTNGTWMALRLSKGSLQPIRSVALPNLSGTPLKIAEAGTNELAIATSSQLLLVNLANPGEILARISLNASGEVILSFDTANGATYAIERSETLFPPNWTTLLSNITGTGGVVDEPLSTTETAEAFYRVARAP